VRGGPAPHRSECDVECNILRDWPAQTWQIASKRDDDQTRGRAGNRVMVTILLFITIVTLALLGLDDEFRRRAIDTIKVDPVAMMLATFFTALATTFFAGLALEIVRLVPLPLAHLHQFLRQVGTMAVGAGVFLTAFLVREKGRNK
jgi:hypothetical protein